MSEPTPSAELRFVVESWAELERFFATYEDMRRQRGFGQNLQRVTPQQRIDALAIVRGLNATGGWRRLDAESPESVWLRHLAPLLAETPKAGGALRAAAERALPGRFEPAAEDWEPPVVGKTVIVDPPPSQSQPASRQPPPVGRWLLRAGVGAGMVAFVLVAAFGGAKWVEKTILDRTAVNPGSSGKPGGSGAQKLDFSAVQAYDDVNQEATDLAARSGAFSPRMLAQFEAFLWPLGPSAQAYLIAMLRRLPGDPDHVAADREQAAAEIRQYAIAIAALRYRQSEVDLQRAAAQAQTIAPPNWTPTARDRRQPAISAWLTLPRWLVFAPLAVFSLVGLLRLPQAARAGLRAAEAQERGAPIRLPLAAIPPPQGRSARDLARRLGSRRRVPGRRLDAERSIRATLDNKGLLTPKMRPESRAIEYLFLIAGKHRRDHERDRVLRLLELLRSGGAPIEAFDYDADPRRLWPAIRGGRALAPASRGGAPLDLRALAETYPHANLILVTDGEELLDFVSRRPRGFVRGELARWPQRMILTPTPRAEWGERELRLSAALGGLIGRATVEGLEDLVTGLRPNEAKAVHVQALEREAGEASRAQNWREFLNQRLAFDFMPARPLALALDDPALVSEAALGEARRREILRDTRAWLGPHGYFWFAACAVFPQLRFAVTLHLGQTLHRGADSRQPRLFDERLLARLSLLPWFRIGRMPQWLRRAAFSALPPPQRRAAREAVAALLNGDAKQGEGGDAARAGGGDVAIDKVMVDLMLGDSDDELVPTTANPELGALQRLALWEAWRGYASGMILAGLWGLGGRWFWPPSDRGPQPLGGWWPLAAYLTATAASCAYIYRYEVLDGVWRGVVRLRRRIGTVAVRPARRAETVESLRPAEAPTVAPDATQAPAPFALKSEPPAQTQQPEPAALRDSQRFEPPWPESEKTAETPDGAPPETPRERL